MFTQNYWKTRASSFSYFFSSTDHHNPKNNDSFSQFIASISNPPTYSLFSEKEIYVHWIISRKSIEINVTFLEQTFFKHTRASIHLFSQSARGNCEKRNISRFYPHLSVSFSQTCKGTRKKGGGGVKEKIKKLQHRQEDTLPRRIFTFALRNRHFLPCFHGSPSFFKRIFPYWLETRKKLVYFFLCLDWRWEWLGPFIYYVL